jgi:predicted transcriptional regulator
MAKKKAKKKGKIPPRKSPKKARKRKAGRPKKDEKIIGPAELELINRLWLRMVPMPKIAAQLGVDRTTVRHHIDKHLRPRWENELRSDLARDMAKAAQLEQAAWDAFEVSGETRDLEMAKWALEHRAKIAGHFAETRIQRSSELEVRVAGLTPAKFGAETMQLIAARIKDQAEDEAAVALLEHDEEG